MKISEHSIILMVGPSNCGKTHFCKQALIPAIQSESDSVAYISSDDMRRKMLGRPKEHKYNKDMMKVSGQAFDLLFAELNAFTSWPVNKKYVVVDSTALSEDFLKQVKDLAKENHYNVHLVVFDYKNYDDFFLDCENKDIVGKHVNKLKKDILKVLNKYSNSKTKITEPGVYPSIFLDRGAAKTKHLDVSEYAVIGDIHGDKTSLHKMLTKLGDVPTVLVGDLVDKCSQEENVEIINYVYDRPELILVRGNHENFLIKSLENGTDLDEQIRTEYFNSSYITDEEFIRKFKAVYDRSFDYVTTGDAIITHSCCHAKYLGKSDSAAVKEMRNYRYRQREAPISEQLQFLNDQNNRCWPMHIWGHITFNRAFKNNSNLGIDTGATYGNMLTAIKYKDGRFNFVKVPSDRPLKASELNSFGDYKVKISREVENKARHIAQKGIQYLKPTMAPAAASDDNLESLEWALDYYKENSVEEVVLQPKYMGSAMQLYLYHDYDKCFGVTKNGFKIRQETFDKVKEDVVKLQKKLDEDTEFVILDCELMPWRLLGDDLIDRNFLGYYELCKSAQEDEKRHNYNEIINSICDDKLVQDFHDLNKKEFIDKHKHHTYSNIKNYLEFKNQTLKPIDEESLERFHRQVKLYGSDDRCGIEPFAILKTVKKSGEEILHKNDDNFKMFHKWNNLALSKQAKNTSIQLVLNTSNSHHCESIQQFCVENDLEGWVVKPRKAYVEGVAPYIKVRNPEYLRIVYGPSYLEENKLSKLIKSKKVHKKLKKSIQQYELGWKILEEPTVENIAEFLVSKENEFTLDPRL